MLIGSFCHIIETDEQNRKSNELNGKSNELNRKSNGNEAEEIRVRVALQAEHPIYLGHFFGMPITPGACLVEIAEEIIGRPITQIKGLKFLQTVPPTAELLYTFSPKQDSVSSKQVGCSPKQANQYTVTITDYTQHTTYARFNATYLCAKINQ